MHPLSRNTSRTGMCPLTSPCAWKNMSSGLQRSWGSGLMGGNWLRMECNSCCNPSCPPLGHAFPAVGETPHPPLPDGMDGKGWTPRNPLRRQNRSLSKQGGHVDSPGANFDETQRNRRSAPPRDRICKPLLRTTAGGSGMGLGRCFGESVGSRVAPARSRPIRLNAVIIGPCTPRNWPVSADPCMDVDRKTLGVVFKQIQRL